MFMLHIGAKQSIRLLIYLLIHKTISKERQVFPMSIKSNLAKLAPQTIVKKEIAKGEHAGDNWSKVATIINTMCEKKSTADGTEFIYEGKVIGWAKHNGQCWCDHDAYIKMREAYDALPVEDNDEPDYDPEYDECYNDEYYAEENID